MMMPILLLLSMQAVQMPLQDKPAAPALDAVEPLLDDYDRCIGGGLGGPLRVTGDQAEDQRRIENVIRGCRPQRERGVAEADRLLAADPAFADASLRARTIDEGFASVEDEQRSRLTTIYRQFGNSLPRSRRPLRGETSTSSFRALGRDRPSGMTSIDVPFQILPAYLAYTSCVGGRFQANPHHASAEEAVVRRAHAEALAGCRPVREQQLARAFELLDRDHRPFGNRQAARQAAVEAFERFDVDFEVETPAGPAAPASGDEQ